MNGRLGSFLLFFVVIAATGALMVLWMAPMLKRLSDLTRGVVFCGGMILAAAFSIGFMSFFQRIRGWNDNEEEPRPRD